MYGVADQTALIYRTVRAHLETFLARTSEDARASALPAFGRGEFEGYLRCGIVARGLIRVPV